MTLEGLGAAAGTYWPFIAAAVPALGSWIHHARRLGLSAFVSYWRPVSLTYVGTLYAMNIGWLAVTDEQLLTPSRETRAFMGFLTLAVFAFFIARGFSGTTLGNRLRRILEEAIRDGQHAAHPFEEPCEKMGAILDGLRSSDAQMEVEAGEHFHEADGMVRASLPYLKLPEAQERTLLELSEKCVVLLGEAGHLADDPGPCREALARYHGTLRALMRISGASHDATARPEPRRAT